MELDPLTVLNKRYTIKRALGSPGPFDITYLGEAVDSDERYIIREFFPAHLVRREEGKTAVTVDDDEDAELFESGVEYFRKESSVLAELTHEALPASYDHFEANGTYYRVRPHPHSMSLAKGLEDRGALSERAALTIMIPILRALHTAHDNGLYHGGVSPSTIRVLEDGKVLLTGFRGAFFQLARETGHLSELVQPGTSAVEQYTPRGQQGPWTDVYAAAATICQMVTGERLPESTNRLEDDDSVTELVQDADAFSSPGVREALLDALTVDPSKRLQSVEALIEALTESSVRYDEDEASYSIVPVEPDVEDGEESDEEDEVEVLSTRTEEDRPARSSGETDAQEEEEGTGRAALMIGIPVLVLALGGGAWFMMNAGSSASAGGASRSYTDYRQTADSLFENENYDEAEYYYNQALQARGGEDQYVEQRLERLSELQQQNAQQQYRSDVSRGMRLMNSADSLYSADSLSAASQKYSRAMAAFYSALDTNPQGTQAQQMVKRIQKRQKAIAKEQAGGSGGIDVDQIATFFRKQGDRQLQAGNLQAALNKYQQALEYKPNSQELQSVVKDLRAQIEQRQREEQFQEYYNRGRQLMRENKYQAAQAAFDKAAKLKPNDVQLERAIARTDSLLQVQRRQRKQYEQYRARGDSAYDAEAFEEAIAAYKKALDIRPDDQYVLERIEAAQRELKQMKLARQELEEQEKRRQKIVDDQGVYKVVDQQPKVKGGLSALTEQAEYPELARNSGVEGRVYVQAVVNADGSVRSAKVVRGLGAGCDEEALEVVRQAEFIPAKYNGEPVPARTTVFIVFRLADS